MTAKKSERTRRPRPGHRPNKCRHCGYETWTAKKPGELICCTGCHRHGVAV